ncbi:MAG: hypothetical protein M0042_12065 [Nitrospiraceae bacterium]|nr:hypothetical protein [Nitrospiraceae bacterium]
MKGIAAITALLLLQHLSAFAGETKTVSTADGTYAVKESAAYSKKLPDKALTLAGITLGRQSLFDVRGKLGMVEEKTANGAISLCYESDNASDKTAVVFRAPDMISGVTSFTIYNDRGNIPAAQACAKSRYIHKQIATGDGLNLGTEQKTIIAKLGKPTVEQRDRLVYVFSFKEAMTDDEMRLIEKAFQGRNADTHPEGYYWHRMTTIEIFLQNAEVTQITVMKSGEA